MIRRMLYGPPQWVVDHFGHQARMAFGFWSFILACIGAFFFGREVMYVTGLSLLALISTFTSETPVQVEEEE